MLKNNKYYYGISFPKDVKLFTEINYDCGLFRGDVGGNGYIEWNGEGNMKNYLDSKNITNIIRVFNFPAVVSDKVDKDITISEFKEILKDNIEFYNLMLKTNGKGTYKDIDSNDGVDFVSTFIPKFKQVTESGVDGKNRLHVQTEEFTTLEDYKHMKLMEPLIRTHIAAVYKCNINNVKVKVIKDSYGWKLDIIVKDFFVWLYKARKAPLKSIFSINVDSLTNFTNFFKYFINDQTLFSYYNYKSGVIEELLNVINNWNLEESEVFFQNKLMKDCKVL